MSEKLDRLVADKVMGWKIVAQPDDCEGYPEIYSSGNAVCRWLPSTDIAAAWEVVEHLRKQDYLLRLLDQRDLQTGVCRPTGEYDCRFYKSPNSDMAYSCHTSGPMAICLAALRAVGVPEATIQEACE